MPDARGLWRTSWTLHATATYPLETTSALILEQHITMASSVPNMDQATVEAGKFAARETGQSFATAPGVRDAQCQHKLELKKDNYQHILT